MNMERGVVGKSHTHSSNLKGNPCLIGLEPLGIYFHPM